MASTAEISPADKQAILAKYREERDKRLRADGNDQYVELTGQLAHYAEDPYAERTERAPLTDHVTYAFVGGGFSGLVSGARLKEAGIDDLRIVEKGGDFGGTWYWNRYPGAQCDTASMVYMPLLEETGHMPSEKYVHAPEILEHCQRIGTHYDLYDKAVFHTKVESLVWEGEHSHWRITTDRGDDFTADFVGLGTGPLHVPKLPGIPGIESFQGHSFHTSRWDYDYTGGDPDGALLDKLADKRVAIIGTGATAVQIVPHLSSAAKEVFVIQRTPSSIDIRNNEPIDPDWFEEIATEGWQKRWLDNFTANQGLGHATEDLVQDGWTDLTRRFRERVRDLPPDQLTVENMLAAWEDADLQKMTEIRARVDALIADPDTAEDLKAWYRQLCKRPCFHDEYLQSFNNPNTHLIDTDGKGAERITEKGVVVAGTEYEVDCIVYATGFEVGTTLERRMGFDPVGRNGLTLAEAWEDGMRSKHGIHVHGFPNLFLVQSAQGAHLISNYPHNLVECARAIAIMIAHARATGAKEVEVTREAQDQWVALLMTGPGMVIGSTECTPGYYNNEGQPTEESRYFVGYPHGAQAYFAYLDGWLKSGTFEGVEFR
ncbi:MAG: flavin-containing monooxygenase [Parasphingopyxis sp.]|uniref:flavin-containing monooxygenase n=1 Tax=Parasphingopyxis sp. TaxID=1920299 RepID=UPI003F9F0C67